MTATNLRAGCVIGCRTDCIPVPITPQMNLNDQYWRKRANETGRRVKHLAYGRLYRDRYRDCSRTVMVSGVARSGTTWLGKFIASQGSNRLMFEPVNPWPVKPLHSANYIQYKRPTDEDAELADFCGRLFSGAIRLSWIDRHIDHLLPEGRVVKAVRANLMLAWLLQDFPHVRQVLLIHHPCAVVSSWLQLGWTAERDFAALLEQPKLVDDFLVDKWDLIKRVNTVEERIAIVWCVNQLVPLRQARSNDLHVVFYERLITQPEIEVPRLFQAIGRNPEDSIYGYLGQPSTTSQHNIAVVTGQDRLTHWQHKLSASQTDRIMAIVADFKLDFLYGHAVLPNP